MYDAGYTHPDTYSAYLDLSIKKLTHRRGAKNAEQLFNENNLTLCELCASAVKMVLMNEHHVIVIPIQMVPERGIEPPTY